MELDQPNILELRRRSKNDHGIAAFIGAGCSSALRIPMWTEMLLGLNKEFTHYLSEEDLKDDIASSGYAKVASNIKSKASTDQAYKEKIKKYLQPVACHFTSLHLELIRLSKILLTTNYDQSFEESFMALKRFKLKPELEFITSSLGDFSYFEWGIKHNIFHLHGDSVSGDFILTSESYNENYNNTGTGVATLINAIFSSYDTLFVGFSFNDQIFMDFLKRSLEQIRREKLSFNKPLRQHYCIISNESKINYLTIDDLVQINAEIPQLKSENILEERTLVPGVAAFYFLQNAKNNIQAMSIEKPIKDGLLRYLKRIEDNRDRTALLQSLGIEPVYFDGDEFLQIEILLRAINESPAVYATTYNPN